MDFMIILFLCLYENIFAMFFFFGTIINCTITIYALFTELHIYFNTLSLKSLGLVRASYSPRLQKVD